MMNKNVIMALRTARPLPTQNGPVLPFAVEAPPNASIIGGNAHVPTKAPILPTAAATP